MFNEAIDAVHRAAVERAVLFANHLLAAEPVACARLRPHAGRVVRFEGDGGAPWSRWRAVEVRITAAGLLDATASAMAPAPDLTLTLELPPAPLDLGRSLVRALRGAAPTVRVSGDATLAADVDWCFHNVRWDAEHDLSGLIGAGPAHRAAQIARRFAAGLRNALRPGRASETRGERADPVV